jgi:CheY-like chemotaxis protein
MLDLGLPGSMGTESLAAIRQANDQLPIVVLTGLNDEHTACGRLLTRLAWQHLDLPPRATDGQAGLFDDDLDE